ALNTAHTLAILTEYTHTISTIPHDLSKAFADLRELDAVLSSSVQSLLTKIAALTTMLESKTGSKQERLWLLLEIAEEASRLKPGADDKIRVACHAADGLKGHKTFMTNLLEAIPPGPTEPSGQMGEFGVLATRLGRKLVYPHVATKQYWPPGMSGEGGRRQRRGALLVVNGANGDGTPLKRKRAANANRAEEDGDGVGPIRSPRKDHRVGVEHTGQRARGNARGRKNERAASPAESTFSVASHMPQNPSTAVNNVLAPQARYGGRAGSAASTVKRGGRGQNHVDPDPVNGHRNETFNAPPSSSASHPSLPLPFNSNPVTGDWQHGVLEGPGMPVARGGYASASASVGPPDMNEVENTSVGANGVGGAAEAEGDADDGKTYCFCDTGSYGEMIACDDPTCDREWFHLACIGLAVPPDGTWYCDTCKAKQRQAR
ncbi:hypothetical protein C8Q75DRAFT_702274, partial [Abortiporus biennis]